jgi:tetratricopeptide (TPR) repeat protein
LGVSLGHFAGTAQDLGPAVRAYYGEQPELAKSLLLRMAPTGSPEVYYRLGNVYYQTGNLDSARFYYSKGVRPEDKFNYNFAGMAKLSMDGGDVARVQEYIDRLSVNGRSKDTKAYTFIGEAWLTSKRGNDEKAIAAFEKAIALDYKNWEAHILLGDTYKKKFDAGKAISSYEHASDKNPGLALPYVKVGQVYMQAGGETMYGLALENFNKAYATDSSFGLAARELADFYYYARRYPEAIRLYRKYIDLTGTSLEKKSRLAGFLFMNRDYDQASALIEEVLRVDASNIIMNRLLGYMKFEQGKYEEGVEYMRSFFERADTAALVGSDYAYYGRLLAKTGNDSVAVIMLQKAIAADSTNAELRLNLAQVLYLRKQYADAAVAYEHTIRLGQASPQEHFQLGKSWYFAKEFVKADSAFAQVTSMQPSAAVGHLWRAKANVQLDPESTEAKALPHYERFIELATDETKYKKELIEANAYVGTYYVQIDDLTAACPYWLKVKELDPANENATKFLQAVGCRR